ncbi:MAG: hypothetical protein AB1422_06765 [bacterium]
MTSSMVKLKGVIASPGVVIGKAYLLDMANLHVTRKRIPPEEIDKQLRIL